MLKKSSFEIILTRTNQIIAFVGNDIRCSLRTINRLYNVNARFVFGSLHF